MKKKSKRRKEFEKNKIIRSKLNSIKSRSLLVVSKVDEMLISLDSDVQLGSHEVEEYINRMLETCEELRELSNKN